MQRYIAIIMLFIATATSSMADTNGKLIQRIDSIIDNITQIYGKKQARIDFYKSMAHKSKSPKRCFRLTTSCTMSTSFFNLTLPWCMPTRL